MRKRRAQLQPLDSKGTREQPAVGSAAKAIDHGFSAQTAVAGRRGKISPDYANIDNAIPWTQPKPRSLSKPLRSLRRPIKSVPRTTRRFVVEYVTLASILPNPINPRKHSRQQIDALAHSIEAFGFNAPILVDGENRVVAGHARLEAARLFGLQEVPVIRLEHLSEQQAKAYMLADNKLTDRSAWDDAKVAIILKDLSEMALEFEIEATGFETAEIDLRVQSLDPSEDVADSADDFEGSAGPSVSRLADLWRLGPHSLLCGSSLDSHVYGVLLSGEKASAVFTDPPYNVPMKGHAGGKGRRKHREFPMASGEMTEDAFRRFLEDALGLAAAHSVEEAISFACMDWRHSAEIQASALQAIMLQLVQKVLAGSTRASRTYLQYQEFAARRSTKTTELQFDDEQDGRIAGIALKERA
jgi:hypothetical protein